MILTESNNIIKKLRKVKTLPYIFNIFKIDY